MNLLRCVMCVDHLKSCKLFILGCVVLHQVTMVFSKKAELYSAQSFEIIRTSSYPHFVMFYAPWCGHCKRVQTIWDQFAAENHEKRRIKVAKVDCTVHTPICASENIKAYPSFILYSDAQKFNYRGSRDIKEFNQFVGTVVLDLKDGAVPLESGEATSKTEPTPEDVDDVPVLPTKLTKDTFKSEIEEDFTFVDFFAPWCSHCVKLEPTWKKLADALKYNKKIKVAQVDCTADPELCQAQNINGYPTLNLYKDGYLVTQYTQSRTLSNLVGFVQSTLARDDLIERHDEVKEENNEDDSQGGGDEEIDMKLNEETYKGLMSKTPHLVYFHNSGPEFSNMDLLVFEQVQHRLRLQNSNVVVAVIDCSKINMLCTELGIHMYPSVIYFTSIADYSQYFGMIDVEKLVEFAAQQGKGIDEPQRDEL